MTALPGTDLHYPAATEGPGSQSMERDDRRRPETEEQLVPTANPVSGLRRKAVVRPPVVHPLSDPNEHPQKWHHHSNLQRKYRLISGRAHSKLLYTFPDIQITLSTALIYYYIISGHLCQTYRYHTTFAGQTHKNSFLSYNVEPLSSSAQDKLTQSPVSPQGPPLGRGGNSQRHEVAQTTRIHLP